MIVTRGVRDVSFRAGNGQYRTAIGTVAREGREWTRTCAGRNGMGADLSNVTVEQGDK
ncbi:MAG TPA: hypothetical protein VGR57_11350 [Ktedonobacterales bacterium]|nr:hypothetical protein [Ktedonobacterales bacterium]